MNDGFLEFLRVFIFINEECLLSCRCSLNNKKIRVSRQKLNFARIKIREFVFVGPFALLYCRKFGQNLQNSNL